MHAATMLNFTTGTTASQPRSAPPQLTLQNANNVLQQQQQQQQQNHQQQQQQQQQIAPGMPVPAVNPFAQMKLPPTLMACLVSHAHACWFSAVHIHFYNIHTPNDVTAKAAAHQVSLGRLNLHTKSVLKV
jgi:hypothetical protein